MEGSENVLEAIFDEEHLEDIQDVEMLDSEMLEEGECREKIGELKLAETGGEDDKVNQESSGKNRRRRAKKKKKKNNNKSGPGPNITDINKFVIDTCRRLKERKPYLVWNAVGCLGVSALSDLVKEVDAIQACGGKKTADGKRYRLGGGILWGILKARDPNAYKEIMTKGKEFESQFKPQNNRQAQEKSKDPSSTQRTADSSFNPMTDEVVCNGPEVIPPVKNEIKVSNSKGERTSVLNRIRVPVKYEDLIVGEDVKDLFI